MTSECEKRRRTTAREVKVCVQYGLGEHSTRLAKVVLGVLPSFYDGNHPMWMTPGEP